MAIVVNYTDRDFETVLEALKVRIQTKFPTTYRDMTESSAGIAILQLMAMCFDNLSFNLDVRANEQFQPTARHRDSILNLGKMVGYRMRTATSAAVVVRATLPAVQLVDTIIPTGTTVSVGSLTFVTLIDQRIAAGSLTGDITFVEGVSFTDNYVASGSSFQREQLTRSGVIYGSESVVVNGEDWELERSLVYGDGDSKIYTIEYDDDDNAFVQFGDGTNGALPPVGTTIAISYRVGGGVAGNLSVGQIATNVDGTLDGILPPTTISVGLYNSERGSGGEERETTEHARLWIPPWVMTNGRAVTLQDYKVLLNTFSDPTYGSPAYGNARLKQVIPELNTIVCNLWARDGTGAIVAPSLGLKTAVYNYFSNNGPGAVRMVCQDVEVEDGEIVYIDIGLLLSIDSEYAIADVTNRTTDALDEFFDSTVIAPGQDFLLSKLYRSVQDIAGVDHLLVDAVTASKQRSETIGIGTGAQTNFTATLDLEVGLPIVPGSVSITGGPAIAVTDDGDGNLIGSVNPLGNNTIDYTLGTIDVTFDAAPILDYAVSCEHRYVLDYQRNDLEATADGITGRYQGSVEYPPVVPRDVLTSQKGIALTDGSQVVLDDGDGNFTGDIDPAGVNRFDYDTGTYDFTFLNVPAVNATIYSAYRQLLSTASEDIPIGDDEMPVKGLYTIRTS